MRKRRFPVSGKAAFLHILGFSSRAGDAASRCQGVTPPVNVMNYQGYVARIEYSDEDGLFEGHIADIKDTVGFMASQSASFAQHLKRPSQITWRHAPSSAAHRKNPIRAISACVSLQRFTQQSL